MSQDKGNGVTYKKNKDRKQSTAVQESSLKSILPGNGVCQSSFIQLQTSNVCVKRLVLTKEGKNSPETVQQKDQ